MADQPLEVIGQVAKGHFRHGAGQPHGADEQMEPVLRLSKNMLDMGADRGFGGVTGKWCEPLRC